MHPEESRYDAVIRDQGNQVFFNCRCQAPLLRMERDKHQMYLKQISMCGLAIRGRCPQCNLRHDISIAGSGSIPEIGGLFLSFVMWMVQDEQFNIAQNALFSKKPDLLDQIGEKVRDLHKGAMGGQMPRRILIEE